VQLGGLQRVALLAEAAAEDTAGVPGPWSHYPYSTSQPSMQGTKYDSRLHPENHSQSSG
jgi:hypothetical protein